MLMRTERLRHSCGRCKLGAMALTVVDAERVTSQPLLASNSQCGGGIQATGEQHDSIVSGHDSNHLPGVSPHNTLCN